MTGKARRRVLTGALVLAAACAVAACAFIAAPVPKELLAYRPVSSVRIYDRQGGLLRELLSRADGRSTPLAAEEIPPQVRAAFLAAEDKGFFGHGGVSPTAIARAVGQNLKAGKVVSGGSTITQQLSRALKPRPRTLPGKLQEALWALRLESHLSKEQILTQYLNRVPFGNNTFGLEAAAQLYFGKKATHLSLAQAALLASIPRGPTAYNPWRAPRRLEARRQWVLSRLAANKAVSAQDIARARTESVDLTAFAAAFRAPHFVDFVAANLHAWGLADAVEVHTSLDPSLQEQVEDQVAQELTHLAERRVSSAAAVVIDNQTGAVLAYQGSGDFFSLPTSGQNDGVQMHRQPGSALKPFVYAEAFRGRYTPATVIPDLEASFGSAQGSYSPKNYDRRLHGPVRAREALANSYNVPAVRVASDVGVHEALTVLRQAGFASLEQSAEHYGLGLVLGNGEVSLWETARAYAGLSRGGLVRPLRPVLSARRADGSVVRVVPESQPRRFADARAVALVTDILSDNGARARAFGLDNALRLPFPTAAKTGTSKGYSDNWTAGYTKERTVAVWAGNFDGTPMVQVSGITGAGPIFRRVMQKAMAGVAPAPLVPTRGLERRTICPLSGERAGEFCPAAMPELFLAGTAPEHDCRMHGALSQTLPPDLQARCRALAQASGRLVDLGVDFYDWARNEGLSPEPWLTSLCLEGVKEDGRPVAVLHPSNGDEFLLLSDLPLEDQSIPLRVRAAPSVGQLTVLLDGEPTMTLNAPYTGRIPARRGAHRLEVVRADTGAAVAEVRYLVREEQRL